MSIVRFAARPLLAAGFVADGAQRLRSVDTAAAQLQPLLAAARGTDSADAALAGPSRTVARAAAGAQVGAGILLGLGRLPRLAATVLACTSVLDTYLDYRAAPAGTDEERKSRRTGLLRNLSLLGAVLLAAVDTAGRPGLAWRTGKLADDTRRSLTSATHTTGKAARRVNRTARRRVKAADKAIRSTVSELAA